MRKRSKIYALSLVGALLISNLGAVEQRSYANEMYDGTATDASTETQTDVTTDMPEEIETAPSVETTTDMPEDTYYGYLDIDERAEGSVRPYSDEFILSADIPDSYDARTKNVITEVKDQGAFGTCWAFSALGAGEASMISNGYSDINVDFSEYQLAYFLFHHVDDPLGNTVGDDTIISGGHYLKLGGNHYFSMMALAGWTGACDETDAPYSDATLTSSLDSSMAFQDVAHMQNCNIIPMSQRDDIKKMIMKYGAVATSMYIANYYYTDSTDSYYYTTTGNYSANHGVQIIGWDDNYDVSNFASNSKLTPANNGAWLVKNSNGDRRAYFWISYEDIVVSNRDGFVFEFEPGYNYGFNYQYDGSYGVSNLSISDGDTLANTFVISGSSYEEIKAASIATKSPNINYSLQIYKNDTAGNPLTGIPLLSTPVTGTFDYAGYHTIELPEAVGVRGGDIISVAFTLEGQDTIKAYVDHSYTTYAGSALLTFTSSGEMNQSFLVYENGEVEDLYKEGKVIARIKMFTEEKMVGDMYRVYNPNSGEHFFTMNYPERMNLISLGWADEGIAWTAPLDGSPVYRLYNPNAGDHHYTLSASERDTLIAAGWNYEGIAWYSAGDVPMYRVYNPNAVCGSHHYSKSKEEIDYLVSVGWRYEGIAWYAIQ